jgi:hypothetical protein
VLQNRKGIKEPFQRFPIRREMQLLYAQLSPGPKENLKPLKRFRATISAADHRAEATV